MRQQGQKALSDIIVGREGLGFDLPFWLNITMSLTEGSPPHLKLPSATPVGDTGARNFDLISSICSRKNRRLFKKRESEFRMIMTFFFLKGTCKKIELKPYAATLEPLSKSWVPPSVFLWFLSLYQHRHFYQRVVGCCTVFYTIPTLRNRSLQNSKPKAMILLSVWRGCE